MKKTVFAIICCCAAAVFAGELEIKDILKKSKIGAAAPVNWALNKKVDAGTGIIIQGSEKDEKAFKITSPKVSTYFYSLVSYDAKLGDKVKISADVIGKGTFFAGFYIYNDKNQYIATVGSMKSYVLNGKKQEVEFEFIIPNGIKGEIAHHIRPALGISGGGEVIIEDLEVEIDYKK